MLFDKRWEMKPIDEVSRLLHRAADLIEHCGHTKGQWEKDGAYCVMGAITAAANEHAAFVPIDERVVIRRAITRLTRVVGFELTSWNDDPARTSEEVVTVLRKAA